MNRRARALRRGRQQTSVFHGELDYAAVGLHEIGRPAGYLQRQVEGWLRRYEQVRTAEIPAVAEVRQFMLDRLPPSPPPTVIHNDYKLNNLILAADDPTRVVAVLDWEMCTVGDPLADVGTLLAYWQEPGEEAVFGEDMISVTTLPGFMKRQELLERYARKSGRNLEGIDYYRVFSVFKIAVICQQIYHRWRAGQTRDERFRTFGAKAENLIGWAAAIARTGQS